MRAKKFRTRQKFPVGNADVPTGFFWLWKTVCDICLIWNPLDTPLDTPLWGLNMTIVNKRFSSTIDVWGQICLRHKLLVEKRWHFLLQFFMPILMTIFDDNFWWKFLMKIFDDNSCDNSDNRDLRHLLQYWQLRTWIHDNHCYLTLWHWTAFAILAML